MSNRPTSPDGTPIEVRPIVREELDRVVLRCWPEREVLDRLFGEQGTIGMAAWEGEKCVAQLHCYRVMFPECECGGAGDAERWDAIAKRCVGLSGPAWRHACFHVGRTLESFRAEIRALVLRLARRNAWPPARILEELRRLHVHHVSLETVGEMLGNPAPSEGAGRFRGGLDPRYLGRGIGTALCKESVRWAREHDYVAVIGPGADGPFEFTERSGHLPWTTYAKLGFERVKEPGEGNDLTGRVQRDSPEVVAQAKEAPAAGRPPSEIRSRLMLLDLRSHGDPQSR